MSYIAHIRRSDGEEQTLCAHLLETQALAESLGRRLNIGHLAGLAGLLHDVGKYSEAFQSYIRAAVYQPEMAPKRGSVDHSTAGGQLLFDRFHPLEAKIDFRGIVAEVVGNAIFSHHSYLQDFVTPDGESAFLRRVNKPLDDLEQIKERFFAEVMTEAQLSNYMDKAASELAQFLQKDQQITVEGQLMFLNKFVFSILIDADRTGTRLFAENQPLGPAYDHIKLWEAYSERLQQKLDGFDLDTSINQIRSQLSEQCALFAKKPPGIYTLSIPTGGGKTLTSLRYALDHAKQHDKRRIVYVLPFTTVIEQSVTEVRETLQDFENILEHHSNVTYEGHEEDESQEGIIDNRQKLKLARDNWDIPIVFTTMVQFLNAFYAGGTRNIRRLHQLSDSVLIFDEVQKVPLSCVALFNQALTFLHKRAGASIVLCTATQPALDFVHKSFALTPDAEMIADLSAVNQALKRVHIVNRVERPPWDTEKIADFVLDQVAKKGNALVILNTKSVVRKLYDQLNACQKDIPVYHLSTAMCAAHRQNSLRKVRKQLRNGKPVICISTQLIEAGIDISFSCVIRSLTGLDSIAQAAGRCNRHREQSMQDVYVIDHAEENLSRLPEIAQGKRVTQLMLRDQQLGIIDFEDLLSPSAIERYFQEYYYDQQHQLQYHIPSLQKNMTELLLAEYSHWKAYIHEKKPPLVLPHSYGTAAKHFHVIDQQTTAAIAPYEEGIKLIDELNGSHSTQRWGEILRNSQPYLVQLWDHELEQLKQSGGLRSYPDAGGVMVLTEKAYDKKYGLDLEMDAEMEEQFI